MITISMFIKCVVLIVLIVCASECSGVMYVERGSRVGKILNHNKLRSQFTMTHFYIPVKDQDLSPETYDPNYLGIKNKTAEKSNQIIRNNSDYGVSLQYYPIKITGKNFTLSAQNSLTTENYNNLTKQNDSSVTTEVVTTKAPINYNKSKVIEAPQTNIDSNKYLQQALMTLIINRTSDNAEIDITSLKDELDNSTKEPEDTESSASINEIESILGLAGTTNNDEVLKTNLTSLNNVTEFDYSTKEPKKTQSSVSNQIESIIGILNYDEDAKTNSTNLNNATEFDNFTIEPKQTQSSVTSHGIESIIGIIHYDKDAKTNSANFNNATEFVSSTIEPKEIQSSVTSNQIENITGRKNTDEDAKTYSTSLKNVTELISATIGPKQTQSSVNSNQIENITGRQNSDKDAKTYSTSLKNVPELISSTIEPKQTQFSVTSNQIENITGRKNTDEDAKTYSTSLNHVPELISSTIEPKETQSSVNSNKIEIMTGRKNTDEDAKTYSTSFKNVTELISSTIEPKQTKSSVTSNQIENITSIKNEYAKTNSTSLKNVTELNMSTKELKNHNGVSVANAYDKNIGQMILDSLRKFDERKLYAYEQLVSKEKNNTLKNPTERKNSTRQAKGFFGHGLFALPKVLNFFPVGGERECQPEESTVARAGICLNPYDCRQRGGAAGGDCAHGLGVCCVFEVTCGGVAANNLTYFMSPGFPELWGGDEDCSITIEKAFAGIMQLKIDFVHFTIGQPNRLTGECDEDALILGEGKNNFTLCGQNHGQHIYYNLPTASEKREAGELPTIKSTKLIIRLRGGDMPRLWLLRIAQLPLINSAPNNCLQYFTSNNGTIKTFNFASNGRHLASQEYRACIRRNNGFCAIRYSPCDARSFRIGGTDAQEPSYDDTLLQDQMMEPGSMQDEVEGSGMEPNPETQNASKLIRRPRPAKKQPGFWDMIWSFILPSWLWGQGRETSRQARSFPVRWSPYLQHYKTSPENDDFRYYGYGTFGLGFHGFGRQACGDRITIPCESEYFVSSASYGPGVCDPHHCGSSFCPGQHQDQCRVETSITPFAVSVHFGPPVEKRSPEENIGACLRFQQVLCDE